MKIVVNGQPRVVAEGTSVAKLLDELQVTSRGLAVEVNMELVPRSRHAERLLADGDHVEVVTLVGGG